MFNFPFKFPFIRIFLFVTDVLFSGALVWVKFGKSHLTIRILIEAFAEKKCGMDGGWYPLSAKANLFF